MWFLSLTFVQFHIIGTNLTIVPSTAIDWSPAQPAVTIWARTARAAIQRQPRPRANKLQIRPDSLTLWSSSNNSNYTTLWPSSYNSNYTLVQLQQQQCRTKKLRPLSTKGGRPNSRTGFRCNWKDSSIRSTWENRFSFHVNPVDLSVVKIWWTLIVRRSSFTRKINDYEEK